MVGKAMFTIIGAMAKFERNVIRERVVAGLDYARQHGTKTGNGSANISAAWTNRSHELRAMAKQQ